MIVAHIVAKAKNNEIGKDNDLIWRLPADLKHFKNTTTGHFIITGRKNYESIGRPLPNRTTVIITRNQDYKAEGCIVCHSLEEAIEYSKTQKQERVFIMGGGEIYKESLEKNLVDEIYLTEVKESFEADTFYPALNQDLWKEESREPYSKDEKNPFDYEFVTLVKKS